MIIASDIDGTLAEWHTAFVAHCRIDVTVFDRWDFWDSHMALPEFLAALDAFGECGKYRELAAFPDAIEMTERLTGDGHELIVVTSRPPTRAVSASTLAWVAERGLPVSAVLIGAQWKREVDADLLIDDDPRTVADVAEYGTAVPLLLDRPWNQDAGGLPRVSWRDVPDLVAVLEERSAQVPDGERRWVLGDLVAETLAA